MAYTWPYRLLTPLSQTSRLGGLTKKGGIFLSGFQQRARMDGGGLWTTTLDSITLDTREAVLAARAWAAHLQGGTPFIMPLWDIAMAPRPIVSGAFAKPVAPADPTYGDWFGYSPDFDAPLIVSEVDNDALLRAPQVSLRITEGSAVYGGMTFSIEHETWGWRSYRVERVLSVSPGPGDAMDYLCDIQSPLREAINEGDAVEWDVPRVLMMATEETIAALEPVIITSSSAYPIDRLTFVETPPQ